ncbi:MAG: hypothetical protein JST30_05630 [Armatimonadetes bacterium]|nr:hypothetical protein [Armatimonadota bacterium]
MAAKGTKTVESARRVYAHLRNKFPWQVEDSLTYGELAQEVGGIARGMGAPLAVIQEECRRKGWPTFTVFVVRKSDGLPGGGCSASTPESFRATLADVRRREWPKEAWW